MSYNPGSVTQTKGENPKRLMAVLLPFLIILLFVGAFWGGFRLYQYLLSAPSASAQTQVFVINSGETPRTIGTRLQQDGFIHSSLFFWCWVKKEKLILQYGEYTLAKNIPIPDLALALTNGKLDTSLIIKEGWRREQIVSEIIQKGNLPMVISPQASGQEQAEFLKNFMLKTKEGYLFPETYDLSKNSTFNDLVSFLSAMFWSQFDSDLQAKASLRGLTVEQVVSLASLVEHEVNYDEERKDEDQKLVAGILIKRLQSSWPLGVDATVQYAKASEICADISQPCNWWPEELTQADLENDSPYNTRKYIGLPPTPICNPSLASLRSVVEYEESDYWYYLSDTEGHIHYAKTAAEHNQNINEYLSL